MKDILEISWRISPQTVSHKVGEETVILHLGSETYFGLNAVGSHLWEDLKQAALPSTTCCQVAQAYGVPAEIVENDLRELLYQLAENGLVLTDESSLTAWPRA